MTDVELQQQIAEEVLAELPPRKRQYVTLERVANAVDCSKAAMPSLKTLLACGATSASSPVTQRVKDETMAKAMQAAQDREERQGGLILIVLGFFARQAIAYVLKLLVQKAIQRLWQRYYPGDQHDGSDPITRPNSWDGSFDVSGDSKVSG